MLDESNLPPLGHNGPPPDLPYDQEQLAACEQTARDFADAAGQWRELGKIEGEEIAQRATDFVNGARKAYKTTQEAQKAAKKPWADKADMAFNAFKPALAMIEASVKIVLAMQEDWLKRESARKAEEQRKAQEAARLAREAAQKAAAEAAARNDIAAGVEAATRIEEAEKAERAADRPAQARAGSYTGGGRTVALREVRSARITNIRQLFLHFQDHPDVVATLQRIADAAYRAKGGEKLSIPGTELHIETKAV